MSLNPRLVALQGIGYGPQQAAVQGLKLDTTPALVELPRYYSLGGMTEQRRRRLIDEDEAILAILQMFVMEEV